MAKMGKDQAGVVVKPMKDTMAKNVGASERMTIKANPSAIVKKSNSGKGAKK